MGDRPFTDIVYGNRNGFLTILTEPLSLAEEPFIVKQVYFHFLFSPLGTRNICCDFFLSIMIGISLAEENEESFFFFWSIDPISNIISARLFSSTFSLTKKRSTSICLVLVCRS